MKIFYILILLLLLTGCEYSSDPNMIRELQIMNEHNAEMNETINRLNNQISLFVDNQILMMDNIETIRNRNEIESYSIQDKLNAFTDNVTKYQKYILMNCRFINESEHD